MKRGFTIVELMMVIGIIGVLMGIVTTAASSSMKMSRTRRADALCALVQSGLATYYAQNERWPVGNPPSGLQVKDSNGQTDPNLIELTASDVQKCVYELVKAAKDGNPMMDISGLFVSKSQGERNSGAAYGLDFMSAIHGTKKQQKKMNVGSMYFGYPEEKHGWFRRFKMVYSIPADSITVSKQAADDR